MALPYTKRGVTHLPPPLVLVLLYFVLILIGAIALKVPFATAIPITWSEAIFTATSALTVTGLIVLDTSADFNLFGQIVIICLIQLGGLGLMTFAVLILSMLGLPVGFTQNLYLREDLNQTSASDLFSLTKMILRVVLLCEIVGAALLALVFIPEFGWREGIWQSFFHSISAFNNAGFSLFPDSLSHWVGNPVVNIIVPLLFIIGGLGFTVVSDIWRIHNWRQFSLHTKLMLVGTIVLLIWSTLTFAAMEWTNPATLGGLDWATKLWASWFQAASTRTAGFNTVDIGGMTDSTTLMFMLLMVIGAGSSSTGGGIKVTTFIVLVLATLAFFKRRPTVDIFGRRISADQVMKVLALVMVTLSLILTSLFAMLIFHEGAFLDLAFEAISAFGTVGLSRGVTDQFDPIGRIIMIFIMFIGRVGPLTIGFLLAAQKPKRISYPTGTIYLG
ncbi:TrkH family potassium uptake protein [Cohaesibacter celericrescens]|uniref:Ktr system potassium transporter B n=1 Tax=Cohaesibacter celericrescens TaxID=2067669 RepID=A0A2N5XVD3_9HYPH|nr:TrkH family potassium uptake protein [Cohaesibacter celericrescens]PLW78471.1 Ktr system potassium transporter B [Cohaesibacter celericrescens]